VLYRVHSGTVKLKKDLALDPSGRHVLVVEDLIDTGYTLAWLIAHIESKKPASVKLATFLDKKARRTTSICTDYVGYDCPDEFVVGYGMDYAEKYRCLPFVASLKRELFLAKGPNEAN